MHEWQCALDPFLRQIDHVNVEKLSLDRAEDDKFSVSSRQFAFLSFVTPEFQSGATLLLDACMLFDELFDIYPYSSHLLDDRAAIFENANFERWMSKCSIILRGYLEPLSRKLFNTFVIVNVQNSKLSLYFWRPFALLLLKALKMNTDIKTLTILTNDLSLPLQISEIVFSPFQVIRCTVDANHCCQQKLICYCFCI